MSLIGSWGLTDVVKAPTMVFDGLFGSSVALAGDGELLAVGQIGDNSATGGVQSLDGTFPEPDLTPAPFSGAVHVYEQDGAGSWVDSSVTFKAGFPDAGDQFSIGLAVSEDGSRIAVGANAESSSAIGFNGDETNNGAIASGAVYIFDQNASGDWSETAYIKASDTNAADQFGRSLVLSDDGLALAVGAPGRTSNSGAVYTFADNAGSVWSQTQIIEAPVLAGGS